MKSKTQLVAFLSLLLITCKKEILMKGTPQCVLEKIDQIKSEDKWNPAAQVFSYSYKGQVVYFIPQRCCDIPSVLMDQNCNIICAPDGGISGGGDGRCTDFFSTRTEGKLVWQDPR